MAPTFGPKYCLTCSTKLRIIEYPARKFRSWQRNILFDMSSVDFKITSIKPTIKYPLLNSLYQETLLAPCRRASNISNLSSPTCDTSQTVLNAGGRACGKLPAGIRRNL